MGLNSKIFRAYDIRGIYPEELNEEAAFKIGQAVAIFLKAKKMVVGEDARISSPALREAVLDGVKKAGCDIYYIGQCTTPLFYFAVNKLKTDGGIMITASHNPPQYNGFKIVGRGGDVIYSESGLKDIQKLSESFQSDVATKGKIVERNVVNQYVDFLIEKLDLAIYNDRVRLQGVKFVVDTSNGVAPVVLKSLLTKLNLTPVLLNFEIDGRFPNHSPDISKVENLVQLKNKIIELGANIGFAFDGDADRLSVVDEHGEKISADFITGLLYKARSSFFKKPKVAYDLRFSRSIKEMLGKNGYPSRIGYPFIRAKMREFNADLGGELSGHFDFKEMGYAESAALAMLKILSIVATSGKTVSELIEPFRKYFNSGEINIDLRSMNQEARIKILGKLKNKCKDGKQDFLDGITVEYPAWWFNARFSNTEPSVRVVVEADTKELMENKKEELVSEIKKAPQFNSGQIAG